MTFGGKIYTTGNLRWKGRPSNMSDKVEISIDLKTAMVKQLKFLRDVDENPWLYSGPNLRNAIRRYEQCWLPLASHHTDLQPPLDIHWVWHVHMLAPYFYEEDCLTLVNTVVDHGLPEDEQQGLEVTKKLWAKRYTEPFIVDSHTKLDDGIQNYRSKCSYNFEAAVSRQKVFYYQVSLPHYFDSKFLDSAVGRYKKLLFLKQQNPNTFLVPCYDIDLAWHAHQLEPVAYKKDTCAILGHMYNHNDAVNDRSANSKLMKAEKQTRELWEMFFKEDFGISGAMYRGEPPSGKLHRLNSEEILNLSTKVADITMKSVTFENLAAGQKFQSKISLEGTNGSKCLTRLLGPSTNFATNRKFKLDTSVHQSLKMTIKTRTGFLCCGESQQLASFNYPLGAVVETSPASGAENITLHLDDNQTLGVTLPNVTITASVGAWRHGPYVMKLEPGSFQTYTIPEYIEQLWGPVPLRTLSSDVRNKCYVASHRLVTMATAY